MRYHGCKVRPLLCGGMFLTESSVYTYIKLKSYAYDDASIHISRVQEVQRMVNMNV